METLRSRPAFQCFVGGCIEEVRPRRFNRDADLITGRDPGFFRGPHDKFDITDLNVDVLLGAER